MMSETVVTVQDGAPNNANNPRQAPTVKTEPGQPRLVPGNFLNVLYFKSIPGIVKLVQLALGIICMACASPAVIPATSWFLFVAATSFTFSLLWTFVYLFSVRESLRVPINWILTELLNTGVETVLYAIAFIVQLSTWSAYTSAFGFKASNITAGVFGIFNTIAYAAGTYFLWLEWKNRDPQ
ncbi:CKLF-like MARVEL transmembrane domain-containing protein 4 [Venturia canescens]|uniref:CKLF-like MARVEL transmembrane domain-containing protein 4 n=1 Tax=Venturia canescens TaxID=32260 RepID=UPI001C9CD3CB|nr:CKLF-like MARVEL transmembrane domain-containing protein 4 [Venturia canescens]